jgi:hypothetical protein
MMSAEERGSMHFQPRPERSSFRFGRETQYKTAILTEPDEWFKIGIERIEPSQTQKELKQWIPSSESLRSRA